MKRWDSSRSEKGEKGPESLKGVKSGKGVKRVGTEVGKIEEICEQRQRAHEKLLAMKSKVYQAYLDMEKATFSDGALKKKEKELIAVGISVVINCESCMQWHVNQAVRAGATPQEILEAIEVGMEMGGGPATASARFALDVMDKVCGRS